MVPIISEAIVLTALRITASDYSFGILCSWLKTLQGR